MRGFLATTMTLVVLQVVLQPGVAGRLDTGTGLLTSGIRRLLSPTVAGIPNRVGRAPRPTAAAPGTAPPTPPSTTPPKGLLF